MGAGGPPPLAASPGSTTSQVSCSASSSSGRPWRDDAGHRETCGQFSASLEPPGAVPVSVLSAFLPLEASSALPEAAAAFSSRQRHGTRVMAAQAMAVHPGKPEGGIIRWRERLRHKALWFNLICPLCRRGICAQLFSAAMTEELGEGQGARGRPTVLGTYVES